MAVRVVKWGYGSGRNCARFVLKMELEIQLGIQLGVLLRYGTHPHKDKKISKIDIFEAINTPLIPKYSGKNVGVVYR